jgi:hypothetical protein
VLAILKVCMSMVKSDASPKPNTRIVVHACLSEKVIRLTSSGLIDYDVVTDHNKLVYHNDPPTLSHGNRW